MGNISEKTDICLDEILPNDATFYEFVNLLETVKTPNFDFATSSKKKQALRTYLENSQALGNYIISSPINGEEREVILLLCSKLLVIMARICKKHNTTLGRCQKMIKGKCKVVTEPLTEIEDLPDIEPLTEIEDLPDIEPLTEIED